MTQPPLYLQSEFRANRFGMSLVKRFLLTAHRSVRCDLLKTYSGRAAPEMPKCWTSSPKVSQPVGTTVSSASEVLRRCRQEAPAQGIPTHPHNFDPRWVNADDIEGIRFAPAARRHGCARLNDRRGEALNLVPDAGLVSLV